MKSWKQVKEMYIKNHLAKPLKAPEIRLNALKRIEVTINQYDQSLLNGGMLFSKYTKEEFSVLYYKLKGRDLSGAEKSVINGLYKYFEEQWLK